MDVSADLAELGRTPMCEVSAGIKSILDVGRTLEYLEIDGVCVAAYGSLQFRTSSPSPASARRRTGWTARQR